MQELIGLTLDAARAELGAQCISIVETAPPIGPKSPLLGATDGGAQRVIRVRETEGGLELLVACEQLRA